MEKESNNNNGFILVSIVAIVAVVAIIVLITGNKQATQPAQLNTYAEQDFDSASIADDDYVPGEEAPADFPAEEANLAGDAKAVGATNCIYTNTAYVYNQDAQKYESKTYGNAEDLRYKACLTWVSPTKAKLYVSYYDTLFIPENSIFKFVPQNNFISVRLTKHVADNCFYQGDQTLYRAGSKKASTYTTIMGFKSPSCKSYYTSGTNILELDDRDCLSVVFHISHLDTPHVWSNSYKKTLCKPGQYDVN